MRLGALLAALALAPTLASACAHRAVGVPPARVAAPAASELPPPDAIPGVFAVRQHIVARSPRGGGSFEAVLQKKPGELLLVGLTPFGTRAFLLRQVAGDVQLTKYIARDLPFPPTFIVLDIHRVLDAWLPGPGEGERVGEVAGERIRERWRDGRLVERTFTRVANDPPGEVEISYSGVGPTGLPARVELQNLRFGYSLRIESFP
jgi:hypothetical protein